MSTNGLRACVVRILDLLNTCAKRKDVSLQMLKGEDVARIDDVVIDSENGRVVYCLLSDVTGVEGKIITVPFNSLSKRGENIFVVNATKEKLVAAPVFRSDDMSKRSYASGGSLPNVSE